MAIYDEVKKVMNEHKWRIELFQLATINGVSSLIYSKYISLIKQKQLPVHKILVPSIEIVNHFLNGDNFNNSMEKLIDSMIDHPVFINYIENAPELVLFGEQVEIFKIISDLYVFRNLKMSIPAVITKKFRLDDKSQNEIVEDRDIILFDNNELTDAEFQFIVDEVVLQLLMTIPSMKKEIRLPEENFKIQMNDDEILTIGHQQAICPIHFDSRVFNNEKPMELLSFVTSTTVSTNSNGNQVTRSIKTNVFNQVSVTKLIGIDLA